MKLINLKQFRQEYKITQKQLGESLKLPQSTISYLENGLQEVTDYLLERIKKIYRVDDLSPYVYERETFHNPAAVKIAEKEKSVVIFTGDWNSPSAIDVIEGFQILYRDGAISISRDGSLIIDRNNGIGFKLSHYVIRPEQFEEPNLLCILTTKEWFDDEMYESFKRCYFLACKIADIYPMRQLKPGESIDI